MVRSKGRAGRPWRRLQAQVFREESHCWVCGKWVDQALPSTHRMSRTVDHVHQLVDGGAPLARSNCRLAHRACNTTRSNQLRGAGAGRRYLSVDPRSV